MYTFRFQLPPSRSDWYENDALMLCEEGTVVAGLLMGLNAIDNNVMMKGEDFDKSVSMWSFTDSVHSFLIVYSSTCI